MAKPPASALPSDQLMVVFNQDLKRIIPYLETLLPRGGVERFKQMTNLAVLRDLKLLECSPISLLKALIWCAQKNMEPGVDDGVWLIPFAGKVVPVPAYKGLIKKAIETGSAQDVDPQPVYKNDDFDYTLGLNPDIKHKPPALENVDRGKLIGAYVVIILPNGNKRFRVMGRPAIEKIRNSGAAWKAAPGTGPWADWEEAMFLKTVIKQGLKTIPMRGDLRDLLIEDGLIEVGATVGAILTQAGAEIPLELRGEEDEGEKQAAGPDTSAFDKLVAEELMKSPDEAKTRLAHLQENLKLAAKNTKKTIPQFKVYATEYFHPYTNQKGEAKDGYWKTFLAWEAHPERPWNKEAKTEAGAAGTDPGAKTEDQGDIIAAQFADRKRILVANILEKLIPLADLGLTKLEEIASMNIEDVEKRVAAWKPPKK